MAKPTYLATLLAATSKNVHSYMHFMDLRRYADEIVDDLASTLTEDEKADCSKRVGVTEVIWQILNLEKVNDHIGAGPSRYRKIDLDIPISIF